MTRPEHDDSPLSRLQFYDTEPFACSYLPGKTAISRVAAPPHRITTDIYAELLRHGFRRSGFFVYRPDCPGCQACLPVRLPVARFQPTRTQQRCLARHQNLQVREHPLIFSDEHYRLYLRYQLARHAGGGMDRNDQEHYSNFLLQSVIDTRLIEFSENGVVRMVSVIDVLNDGLSSVYTFYDPDVRGASYGTYSILWQIAQCTANALPFLYLGYWIRDCRKMSYKSNFKPLEALIDTRWQTLDTTIPQGS